MIEKKTKSRLLKYGIAFAVASAIAVIIMWAKGLFTEKSLKDVYTALCDAFFIPGIMYVFLATLFFIAGEGAFDGLSYAFKMAFYRFGSSKKRRMTYGEYKEIKAQEREGKFSVLFLFVVGLIFVAVSLIMLILYYRVK